ncbi:MAG: arylsulfatase [Gammaproteobacteria bacterium]|nr:arylsulfatase [Gammaproteobacteria bacterium]
MGARVWIAAALLGAAFPGAAARAAGDRAAAPPGAALRAIAPPTPAAPAGAPNVLLVLLDDVGFAAASTFGGPVPTPHYEALAAQGLRYNRFHTTAMCSPTRAALLTGRNHHRVGMGGIVDLAFGEPGYTSIIPKSAATLGRVLQLNGYATVWLGKNHVTPKWETGPQGPFDRWPNGLGFDYFYGFMGGATDQWDPVLIENRNPVLPPRNDPDYILDRDLADHAIGWIRQHQAIDPRRPFFLYLAPGTAHVPLQAPRAWIERFRGRFDAGWDAVRAATFERQQRLGVVPADARLTARPASIPAWDSLTPEARAVAARLMEVHAAQLAYFDEQFGRIVAELERAGLRENTLIVYIDGDNGASGESGVGGTSIEGLNGAHSSIAYMAGQLDEMGGRGSFDGYPVGWAWAMSTPFQYTKQVASHLGGTRDGLVVSWPRRIRDGGSVRSQFLHVTDIAPTIYALAGITPPRVVDGVEQMSFDGVSFADSLDDPRAPSRHRSQYFEMFGNRAWYEDGWIAATTPGRLPWNFTAVADPYAFKWELYDLQSDFSQANNLAATAPGRLARLQEQFEQAAARNHVLPLNNAAAQRMRAPLIRPYTTGGRQVFEYFRSEDPLATAGFPDLKNSSWTLETSFASATQPSGTLITQGGWQNGWGLFVFDGRPAFIYRLNALPGNTWRLDAAAPLGAGEHRVRVQVQRAAETAGAAATVTLIVDDTASVSMRLPATVPGSFDDQGIGIGRDFFTPLGSDYEPPFAFNGTMGAVRIRR